MARKVKLSKIGFLGLVVSALIVGRMAFGADLEASKVADLQKIVNNSFATVDLRHYSNTTMSGDEVNATKPWIQSRATIGTTMLDDAFTTFVIFGATKHTETTRVDSRRVEWDSKLSAVKGKYGEITPYVNLYLPYRSKTTGAETGTDADVGIYNEAKYPMETAWGSASILGAVDFSAAQSSRNERIGVERRDPSLGGQFALDEKEENKINKRDASLWTQYSTAASFAPSIVKGLSLTGYVFFTTEFEPQYREDIIDGETRNEMKGYAVAKTTTNQLSIAYKASDKVTIANDTYQRFDGFYEGRRNGGSPTAAAESALTRWGNRVMVTYTLF